VEQPAVAWRVELPAAEPVAAAVPATLDEPATPAEAAAPQTEYWPDDTAEPTGFTETISNPADISPTDLTTTPEVSGVAAATPSQVLATSVNLATSNPWIVWLWVVGLVLTLSGFALTGLLSGQLITTIAAALTALGTAALAAGLVLSGLRWWLRRWPVGH
jgi:hypothetical protein